MTSSEYEMLVAIKEEVTGLRQAFVDHLTAHERDDRRRASIAPWVSAAAALVASTIAVATLLFH